MAESLIETPSACSTGTLRSRAAASAAMAAWYLCMYLSASASVRAPSPSMS
jgi:hypothetical protein